MTDTPPQTPPASDPVMNGADQAAGPGIRILAQFIRDLSFENPRAPESLRAGLAQPQIDLGVDRTARGPADG